MNPIQTGIAVALAIGLVLFFYFMGGLSFFAPTESVATPSEVRFNNTNDESTMADATDLQITDETTGTGQTAEAGDTVTVHYVGTLTNGTVFDASRPRGDEGFTFQLGAGQVIQGWDQGVAGMKEGGKRRLVIPAALAYGSQGIGNVIPPNSTLVFEVELVTVVKGQ